MVTSLIPFLENDDANRALMGANMQRQAVPLLIPKSPVVGTGMEHKAAKDSGVCAIAEHAGTVEYVSADEIRIRVDADGSLEKHHLLKSNALTKGTALTRSPWWIRGSMWMPGKSSPMAQPLKWASWPWAQCLNWLYDREGYNYEDAVLLNENLVKEDKYTSIHIEEFECEARETKLGPEEITRDIPNVGEDALKNLDERGIVFVGAEVKSEDILVGEVTPKGSPLVPQKKNFSGPSSAKRPGKSGIPP